MNRKIAFSLPSDVDVPKFAMFQEVSYEHYGDVRSGVVVGMYWTDAVTSIASGIPCGWTYQISRVFGMPLKEAAKLGACKFEAIELRECDVQGSPAEDSTAFELPEDVEAPAFNMFEQVFFDGFGNIRSLRKTHQKSGHIVGMTYTCPLVAISQDVNPGWLYQLSETFGLSPKQASQLNSIEVTNCLESEMQPYRELTLAA